MKTGTSEKITKVKLLETSREIKEGTSNSKEKDKKIPSLNLVTKIFEGKKEYSHKFRHLKEKST